MHFPTKTFAIIGALTSLAVSTSTFTHYSNTTSHPHPSRIQSRGTGLYVCMSADWAPPCQWLPADTIGTCNALPYASNSISFGPDQGMSCDLYYSKDCNSVQIGAQGVVYPGRPDLSKGLKNMPSAAMGLASYKCHKA